MSLEADQAYMKLVAAKGKEIHARYKLALAIWQLTELRRRKTNGND